MSTEYGLAVANVFHAGDGNLHPLILFDANTSGELHKAETFGAGFLELCVESAAAVTGEHGVGLEKIRQMCTQFQHARTDALPRGESGIRPDTCSTRQGRARTAPLRRVGRDACPWRAAAAPRVAEF